MAAENAGKGQSTENAGISQTTENAGNAQYTEISGKAQYLENSGKGQTIEIYGKAQDKVLPASTSVYLLETGSYDGEKASKLLLVPHTGRSHQLRVHCKYIGQYVLI